MATIEVAMIMRGYFLIEGQNLDPSGLRPLNAKAEFHRFHPGELVAHVDAYSAREYFEVERELAARAGVTRVVRLAAAKLHNEPIVR